MKKLPTILYYVGLVILLVGIGSSILSFFLESPKLSDAFGIVAAVSGPTALIILIIRLVIINQTNQSNPNYTVFKPQKEVKTVDVKEIPKTKEEELYEQYENLYKQNLITKEDLDKKRVELLGK